MIKSNRPGTIIDGMVVVAPSNGFKSTQIHCDCVNACAQQNLTCRLTEAVFTHRFKRSTLENWSRFVLFKPIFEIFPKFKKEESSNLLVFNFWCIMMLKKQTPARKTRFFVFFRPSNWGYFQAFKKHENRVFLESICFLSIAISPEVENR